LQIPAAKALTCFQKSPAYIRLGDNYFNYNIIQIKSKDQKDFESIIQKLNGTWEGDVVETECKGTDKSPKVIVKKATTKGRLTILSAGALKMSLDKEYKVDRYSNRETIVIPSKLTVTEFKLSKNRLIVSEKLRWKIPAGPSMFVEKTLILQVNSDELLIELIHYNHGHFVSNQVMTFKRQ